MLSSIRSALGDVWEVPVGPYKAAGHKGAFIYDMTQAKLRGSDGAAWLTLVYTSGAAFAGNVTVGGSFGVTGSVMLGNCADAHVLNGTL